jgi:hypothetical protein
VERTRANARVADFIVRRSMKRLLKVLLVLVGVAALAYGAIIGYALWDFRERQVTLPAQTQQPLTEEQAVTLSREALHRVGEDSRMFRPRTYDGTHLYARNTVNPYSGYVLWASTGNHPGFSVQLDQTGGEVRCGVSRCK